MADNGTKEAAPKKRIRTRSPAYPFVNLEGALLRARQFHAKEQRNAANVAVAATHWGFKSDSSNAAQILAALISFGLLQDDGVGDKRTVRLTQNALRILLDTRPDSKEREELIKQAALAPKIHRELWKKWGTKLPSDAQLRHTLLFEWPMPFNENSVGYFIREYKSTIAFAKLLDSDKVDSEVKDNGDSEEDAAPYIAKIGDYVQWEHNGVLGFPEALKVKGISPDGTYAYVDGQNGAVPIKELIRESAPDTQKPADVATMQQRIQSPSKTPMQELVVTLSNGGKAVFQWPGALSKADIDDLTDSLEIVKRKITRSLQPPDSKPPQE
jgi:hypothetical protein